MEENPIVGNVEKRKKNRVASLGTLRVAKQHSFFQAKEKGRNPLAIREGPRRNAMGGWWKKAGLIALKRPMSKNRQ